MKNKIFKTLFLIIMVFSLSVCSDVRANSTEEDVTSNPGFKFNPTTREYYWHGSTYVGIRISIVDSKGQRIPGTLSGDYFTTYTYHPNNTLTETHANSLKSMPFQYWYNSVAATGGMRKEVISQINNRNFNLTTKSSKFQTLNFLPYMNIKGTSWEAQITDDYFEKYFKNMDKSKFNMIFRNLSNGGVKSEAQICEISDDWYFVIEPLTTLYLNPGYYVGTITELAYILANADQNRIDYLQSALVFGAKSIYMEGNIKSFTGFDGAGNIDELDDFSKININPRKGYAVGVYKISDIHDNCPTICWKSETTCDPVDCTNTDSNNETTCRKKMVSYECEYDEKDNDYNSAGEKTFDINGACSLYCTEKASVSYPGNIGTSLGIYEPFAWPTNGGKYPLTTTATLTCTPMMNNGNNADATCLAALAKMDKSNFKYKNSTTTAQVNYQHYQYDNSISADLVQTCEPSTFGINRDGKYEITSNCTYTLSSDKNVAISKEKADLINSAAIKYANTVNNFILITKYKGVLPQSGFSWIDDAHTFESLYDALEKITFSKNYELRIKNMPLGHNGEFTTLLNDDKHEYVCKYNITLAPSTECICPPGTVWAGTDINGKIKDIAQTCAEAKEIYCNQETITPPKHNNPACPPDSKYPERNCTDYINNGGTEAECIANWCNDSCTTNCDYVCPKKSDYPGMDISACVSGQLGAGKKLAQAQSYCIEKNCYRGANIIYRTISLENPFPSKDADAKVNQTGLTKGMFNTTIKGRYPGTNWNSVTLVRNKILNNRGYSGSEIYEKAKPLYVIELDPTAIKKIREYNKRQEDVGGYADFTLKCTDGAYCISSFIRSGITTADGTNMLTGGTCASASNKKTFTNCYTYK